MLSDKWLLRCNPLEKLYKTLSKQKYEHKNGKMKTIKGIPLIETVLLSAYPRATIANTSVFLTKSFLEAHDIINVHVGTHGIGRRESFGGKLSDFGNLFASFEKVQPDICIIIYSTIRMLPIL